MKKTMTVLAAALAMSTAVHAAGPVEGYAQIGFTDTSGYDDGLALKLGADFEKNLGGVKGLGLTAFFSHWSADSSMFGVKSEISANVFAGGVTYDLPIPNSKFTVQPRWFAMITRAEAEVCYGWGCAKGSDTEFELFGLGVGGSYKLDNRMSIRVDYDMLDDADIITAGVGYKF